MGKVRILSGNRLFAISSIFILARIGLPGVYAADIGEAEKVLGVKGQMQEGTVVFSFPRSDIKVRIDGEPVPTALGFGSWTAWKAMGDEFMVMGDLVLLEKEINPVISALAEANIKCDCHSQPLHRRKPTHHVHAHRRDGHGFDLSKRNSECAGQNSNSKDTYIGVSPCFGPGHEKD